MNLLFVIDGKLTSSPGGVVTQRYAAWLARGVIPLLISALAACGAPVTPTAVRQSPTPVAISRATLPPAWTPTFTPTPEPPTPTVTPSPTPTITPTLSPAALCGSLWLMSSLAEAAPDRPASLLQFFAWEGAITVLVSIPAQDVKLRFLLTHRPSQASQVVEVPGGRAAAFQLPVRSLLGTGQYDWTLSIHSPVYGALCPRRGTFIVAGRESTRAAERGTR
jgi:hypothetical protein